MFIFARICIETMSEKATYDIVRTESLVPKNIIESYVLSEARYNLGIYAQRLLYRLLESAQKYIYDIDFQDGSMSRQIEVGALYPLR